MVAPGQLREDVARRSASWMARVVVARSATTALKDLDHLVAEAVLDSLGELARDPVVGHALRGR